MGLFSECFLTKQQKNIQTLLHICPFKKKDFLNNKRKQKQNKKIQRSKRFLSEARNLSKREEKYMYINTYIWFFSGNFVASKALDFAVKKVNAETHTHPCVHAPKWFPHIKIVLSPSVHLRVGSILFATPTLTSFGSLVSKVYCGYFLFFKKTDNLFLCRKKQNKNGSIF